MNKICKSCKSEIDPKATKCRHCGTDQRNWFRRHLILVIILILLTWPILWAVITGFSEGIAIGLSKSQNTNITPTPIVSESELKDMAQRYYDSHKDSFEYLDLTTSKSYMKSCLESFKEKDYCENIINKQFKVGMQRYWVRVALGDPSDINEYNFGDGEREQWIYGNPIYGATYIHFDDEGNLKSYQQY